jgi:S-adenosylmethionine:tRNA ribosyltransferase-isomerase
MKLNQINTEYWYDLPSERIALQPHTPSDECKLLIVNTKTQSLSIDMFKNISHYIPENSIMVMNDSKVIPARVIVYKETGGKVELLLFGEDLVQKKPTIRGFSNTKLTPKQQLYTSTQEPIITVFDQQENIFLFTGDHEQVLNYLKTVGTMPIPPYLKKTRLSNTELETVYQPPQAKHLGSSAAATASLHFSDRVFNSLDKVGVERVFTTLHVGLGTFAQLTEEMLEQEQLHSEWYEVNSVTQQALSKEKTVIAVGTTVVRTLESFAKTKKTSGETTIFISPGHQFKEVDILITNFHVPSSSLLMFVQAFLEFKQYPDHITKIYQFALKNNFNFLSFGDAMIIL